MLIEVKQALRIRNNVLDNEISALIEACKADLRLAGVNKIEESDPLIKRAIIVYCKANFGLDNPDSQKYQASYESLKMSLSLAGDYNA